MSQTIAAISTPPAPAGLGVIRLSGDEAVAVASRVFRPGRAGRDLAGLKGYTAAYGHVFDEEGQKKVERHKRMRAGKGFVTIAQPTDIMQCLPALREAGGGVVLLECMSNLAANEMFDTEEPAGSEQVAEKIVTQIGVLAQETEELVIVTNNVFEDGIVYDTSTMEYLRALGSINVRLAERSDVVVEVIAGIPVARKGKLPVAAAEKQGHRQKGAPACP